MSYIALSSTNQFEDLHLMGEKLSTKNFTRCSNTATAEAVKNELNGLHEASMQRRLWHELKLPCYFPRHARASKLSYRDKIICNLAMIEKSIWKFYNGWDFVGNLVSFSSRHHIWRSKRGVSQKDSLEDDSVSPFSPILVKKEQSAVNILIEKLLLRPDMVDVISPPEFCWTKFQQNFFETQIHEPCQKAQFEIVGMVLSAFFGRRGYFQWNFSYEFSICS
jgi:hypothetical protein